MAHADGRVEAATTIEVIQEFAHVFARRRSRTESAEMARQYAAGLLLLVTANEDLELGLTIFEKTPLLGAFDAILSGVAINRRADALVTADRAFGGVGNLRSVAPGSPEAARLLGG